MRLRPAYEIQVLVMSSNRPHGGPPKKLRRKLFVRGVIVEPDRAVNSQLPIYVAPLPKLDIGFALKTSASKYLAPLANVIVVNFDYGRFQPTAVY